MIIKSHFKPVWWLQNPHAQTIYPTITRRIKAPVDKTERFELPDGDFLDLAWACHGLANDSPLIIILHGLGGNIRSTYVAGFMRALNKAGYRCLLMHFRGASLEPNRLARAYHSGETGDLDFLLQTLALREPHTKKGVIGVSLGGNVLLKWLGEKGAQDYIQAACAISVPMQLDSVADRVNKGFSRVYQAYLLHKLRKVFARKLHSGVSYSDEFVKKLKKSRSFWVFDDVVTAPLHGFPHVHAYYRESSSKQFLKHIATPTLIIQSRDDPFMTESVIPSAQELSDAVTLELSEKGGHVGFITGDNVGKPAYWLDVRIPEYFKSCGF
jgi:predicted alpha/beta-fold hydrolase